MKLNKMSINKKRSEWLEAGIELPEFDLEKMIQVTKKTPKWVHFGSGNIFRAFLAPLQQKLLDLKQADTGIIAVETYDFEIVDKMYKPYDNLGLLVLMNADGSLHKRVVGSIADSLVGDFSRENDWLRLKGIFSEPTLQMVSFTVTEKGYSLTGANGEILPVVKNDMDNGPDKPNHLISKVASLAYTRYKNGKLPIAFVSMDNCSHNGELLQGAVTKVAAVWVQKGTAEKGFLDYINDPSTVSFPWTMIDKITPRPSEIVKESLNKIGFESTDIICTDKKTFIAPFINAEVSQYLVVEDSFPNGRMPLEMAGVIFADREAVNKVEKMKVGTCLNPLHTALAVFGCLLGYQLIADEMKDEQLRLLVEKIGYVEGMPVVVHPGIMEPEAFIHDVLKERLPNPNIPDTPQRIATDTSQKMAVRFGETLKSYNLHPELDPEKLTCIPLVIAGWCRYLMGLDDNGEIMNLSPDPLLEELKPYFSGIELGKEATADQKLKPVLSSEKLFGLNLYEIGLGTKIEGYFKEMISGKQAVRNTLKKYLG